jgi:acyl-coenzyme A thioesterase PaaI-like protein
MTDDAVAPDGDASPAPERPEPPGLPEGAERLGTPGSEGWSDLLTEYASTPPSPRRAELHRTGDALRRIVHRLHGSLAAAGELADVADDLERLARRLDDLTMGSMYEGFGESPLAGADPHAFFDHSPMLGRANPLAPPIELWPDGKVMRGRVTFEAAYEGPPGCVHGGYVAAAFDEVLGSTQSLGGRPGMTGRLTIHYRSPTPLRTELTFAARVVEVTGRKTLTHGTLHAGDRLCAEAEGLFIAIDFAKMLELRAERERRFPS